MRDGLETTGIQMPPEEVIMTKHLCIIAMACATCGACAFVWSSATGLADSGTKASEVVKALKEIGASQRITRVIVHKGGDIYIGTCGGSRASYDGTVYKCSSNGEGKRIRLLELGPNAAKFKDAGLVSRNPYLVDVTNEGQLIINVETQASFPTKVMPQSKETGNVLLYDVSADRLSNLTQLAGESGLYAHAIAYVPREKVVIVDVGALEYDKMPFRKPGRGRPQFVLLNGKALPADRCPIAAKLYSEWESVQPLLRVVEKKRVWEWEVGKGQFVTIRGDGAASPPIVRPLSPGVFCISADGLGTFIMQPQSGLFMKVSSYTALGNVPNSGLIILRQSEEHTVTPQVIDVAILLRDVTKSMRGTP